MYSLGPDQQAEGHTESAGHSLSISDRAASRLPPPLPIATSSPHNDALGSFQWSSLDKNAQDDLSVERKPSVWTFAAKMFILSISGFVLVTVSLLVATMRLQALGTELDVGITRTSINNSIFYTAYLLGAQAIVCELVLLGAAVYAVLSQNLIVVLGVLCFNLYLVIAGFIEAGQRHYLLTDDRGSHFRAVAEILWAVVVVDICFHFGSDWAAWKLYRELGWKAYKQSSADVVISRILRQILILRALAFYTIVFIVVELSSVLIVVLDWIPLFTSTEPIVRVPQVVHGATTIIIPAAVLVFVYVAALSLLKLGVKGERKSFVWFSIGLQVLCFALHFVVVGYFCPLLHTASKIISLSTNLTVSQGGALSNEWKLFFQFSITSFLLLGTFAMTIVVLRGFGKGLKEREQELAKNTGNHQLDLLE